VASQSGLQGRWQRQGGSAIDANLTAVAPDAEAADVTALARPLNAGPEEARPPAEPVSEPQRLVGRVEVLTVLSRGFLALGLLLVAFSLFVSFFSWRIERRSQLNLTRRFNQELSSGAAPAGGHIRPGAPVAIIGLPRLHQRLTAVQGTTSNLLKSGPGHLRASPLPGQAGNAVIVGRRMSYGGPFLHLDRVRKGDRIITTTGQGGATYVVDGPPQYLATGRGDVLGATADNRLTLITSDPPLLASQRLVVTAALSGRPYAAPAGRPTDVRADEDGLRGQTGAAGPLLLWSGLLLVAVVGAAWLARRWRARTVWLAAVPVVAALLWLLFGSVVALLPATL
jgi:sortase A